MNSLLIVAAAILFNPSTGDFHEGAVEVDSLQTCADVLNYTRTDEIIEKYGQYPVVSACLISENAVGDFDPTTEIA